MHTCTEKKKSTAFPSLLVLSSSKYLEGSQQHRRLKQSSLANWSIDPDRATGGIITTEKSRKRKAWPVWYLVPYRVPVIRRLQHIFGPFFFSFFFLSIPFILPLPFCSLSLLVVTQMRGHIAGSSHPLPTTVRASHFLSRQCFSSFFPRRLASNCVRIIKYFKVRGRLRNSNLDSTSRIRNTWY